MLTVTKEFKWDMAHMLAGHEGQCKNLHGHTYKMEVEIARKEEAVIKKDPASAGMVIDFKDLKQIVKQEVVNSLDHAFIYWSDSTDQLEHKLAKLLMTEDRKVLEVDFRPTAENMALYFFKLLAEEFKASQIDIISLKLWETPTSYAVVRGDQ